jgi:hypothetical protein
VLPELAAEIGINEALFLQQLHFLLEHRNCHVYKDKLWYRHTVEEWLEIFPYFSKNTLRRTIESLVKRKILIKDKLHWKVLKIRQNPTIWYAIDYEKLQEISEPIEQEIKRKKIEKIQQKQDEALETSRIAQNGQNGIAQNGQNLYKTKNIKKEVENRQKDDAENQTENNRLADKMKKLNRKVITDEHREIANSLIAINNQFRKGIGLKEEKKPLKTRENWSNVIRLMMEKDGKTREQILDMYEWAKSHTFWSTNINNPTRLRQNFSAMEEQRAAKGRKLKKIKRTAEECPAL